MSTLQKLQTWCLHEVHASENQLTVSMSAIDSTLLNVVQTYNIKGAEIIIKTFLYLPDTTGSGSFFDFAWFAKYWLEN